MVKMINKLDRKNAEVGLRINVEKTNKMFNDTAIDDMKIGGKGLILNFLIVQLPHNNVQKLSNLCVHTSTSCIASVICCYSTQVF